METVVLAERQKRGRPRPVPDYGPGLHLRLKRGEKALFLPTDKAGQFHTVWLETHLIDKLYSRGVLGWDDKKQPTEEAHRRRQAGEEMRSLFQRAGMEHKSSPMDGVPIQQAGVPKDIAWSAARAFDRYRDLMRELGPEYSHFVQEICCYDRMPNGCTLWKLLSGLDILAEKIGV